IITFQGPVDPTRAENPGDYSLITPSGKTIPIKSATYNPATNSVTLVSAQRLNVHHHFRLSVVLPCPNNVNGGWSIIPFGGKGSLIGFHNHRGDFVSVQNGRIVGFDNRRGQFVRVRNDRIQSSSGDRPATTRQIRPIGPRPFPKGQASRRIGGSRIH